MTEEEWQRALPPVLQRWQKTIRPKSLRKERLFACACCRVLWPLLTDESYREALALSERYADDESAKAAMQAARKRASNAARRESVTVFNIDEPSWMATDAAVIVANLGRDDVFISCPGRAAYALLNHGVKSLAIAHQEQSVFFRDIFGNPFRPVAFDPAWRTEHTVGIAAKMYDGRDFRAMPILADALEEAGCDNPDILTHCREPGVHVRGCWVVDLVLGK